MWDVARRVNSKELRIKEKIVVIRILEEWASSTASLVLIVRSCRRVTRAGRVAKWLLKGYAWNPLLDASITQTRIPGSRGEVAEGSKFKSAVFWHGDLASWFNLVQYRRSVPSNDCDLSLLCENQWRCDRLWAKRVTPLRDNSIIFSYQWPAVGANSWPAETDHFGRLNSPKSRLKQLKRCRILPRLGHPSTRTMASRERREK